MFSSKSKSTRDVSHLQGNSPSDYVDSTFASRHMTQPIPKSVMPEESLPANVVYQVIRDLRQLDSRPVLNLASFVTTYMEDEARQLMMDSLDVRCVLLLCHSPLC